MAHGMEPIRNRMFSVCMLLARTFRPKHHLRWYSNPFVSHFPSRSIATTPFLCKKMKRTQRNQHLSHLSLSHVLILCGTCAISTTLNVYIFNDVDSDVFIPDYVTSIYLLCYQPETNKLPSSCELATLRLCALLHCNFGASFKSIIRIKCV